MSMRLGIIGPGLIWQKRHRAALAKLASAFSITAFCASSERRKAATLLNFPAASFETDLAAFVERGDIDAVVVLTPIHLNAQAALAALRADKDVFLEKPIAHTLQAGRDLIETAQQHGRQVWVLEQMVYQPRWHELKNVIHEDLIGDLVYFDQVIHWPLDASANHRGGYGRTSWRIQPAYPLGSFFDGGAHQVAVLSTLFGAPDWVFATGIKLRQEYGEYDHIVVQLGYAPQLRGVLSHSSCLGERHNSFIIWGTKGSVTIEDDRLVVESYQGECRQIEVPQGDAHDEMWSALARSIAQGDPPGYTLAQAWRDLAVLFAVEQSINTGGKVNLNMEWMGNPR
jgi:scyllo-inositol 2-dehydrogenase (NADP+)